MIHIGQDQIDSGKIKKLPDEVISKIAAGEVVINPASVVKELIENAIDAQASNIDIQIKNGGKSYIKVADNGIGMSNDDLLASIQRYTTSKISEIEDIYRISSYGFRGEALASIVDVSRTVITTCDGSQAYRLEVVGGNIVKTSQSHREKGTTVEIYDLFFNLPARRKFLSSEKVETRMVTEMVERFLLVRPDLSFTYKVEDDIVYNVRSETLNDRFSVIFPDVKEFQQLSYDGEKVKISGIISSPQHTRRNRTGQLFFVNGRFIVDNLLHLALERGYGESLMHGLHPYAVVFLNVVPDTIDVNIHPQKLQVKFSEPQVVYNELARAVRETLRQFTGYQLYVDKRDSALFASEPPVENSNGKDVRNVQSDWQDGKRASDWRNERNGSFSGTNATGQSRSRDANTYYPVNRSDDSAGNIQLDGTFGQKISTLQRIGKFTILRNRYILFEDVDGIVIVDFHAAHERIIYERLKEKTYSTVPLLIPIEVSLPKSVEQVLDELKDALEGAGFTFSIEEGKVKITQIPSILNVTQARDVFMEVLEEYRLPFDKPKSLNHVLASKACKAAIKTGDPISESEAEQLVNEVREKGLLTCPHGRPILMKLTFSQLDSYFERI
ncbi:MAG TPA: DNA mismatch repair endonuclease MutL [Fervidobacterium sp.]|nr:DNA mismatch repair endonuclease MutL [Fervidobacterium sp.]HPC24527.1 DNA mismatch repair endonuclease MutL [Fervidobacterium sp.]HQO05968.1 DNA mismatch repair endonuclease MutL [Fervidobacterium sp.]